MKTAIYIEQGVTQLVLTPENEWETNVVKAITTGSQTVDIKRGEFYENRSGYFRHVDDGEMNSLILVTRVNANLPRERSL